MAARNYAAWPPAPPARGPSSLGATQRRMADMIRALPPDVFDSLPESRVDLADGTVRRRGMPAAPERRDPQSCHTGRYQSPLQAYEAVLRQECAESAVFGVLHTPRCQRKATYHGRATVTYQEREDLTVRRDDHSSADSLEQRSLSAATYSALQEYRRPRLSAVDYRSRSFADHNVGQHHTGQNYTCCFREHASCCDRPPPLWRIGQPRALEDEDCGLESAPVTHCVNPNVHVSRQVLSDNFQDFCQTMLASERQVPEQQQPRVPAAVVQSPPTKPQQVAFRLGSKDSPRRRSLSSLSRTSIVQEVLKKMSSQAATMPPAAPMMAPAMNDLSNADDKETGLDQDALQVIQQLDLSIAGDEEVFVDGPPPPVFPRPATDSRHVPPSGAVPNGTCQHAVDSEVQNDNLIEEVCFPGSNKKSYAAFGTAQQTAPPGETTAQSNGYGVTERRDALLGRNNELEMEMGVGDAKSPAATVGKALSDTGDICVMPVDECQLGRSDTADSGVASRPESGSCSHFVVVAIDFGTTYSGYAFSFTRDPDNVHMMRKWEGGDPGVVNQKTPTTLLLNPDGEFHSFGFTARDVYHDLDGQEAKQWMFFEKFKMTLHSNENLSRDTEIRAANGRPMAALTVFAHALRYFRDQALKELSEQSATTILPDDVRWVVTVPAIWRQPAKQFMRAAAYKAGIGSPDFPEQLIIALEPEAASVYCRKLRMHQLVPEAPARVHLFREAAPELNTEPAVDEKPDMHILPPLRSEVIEDYLYGGTKYMVVDCGGGTVDITVHELHDQHGTLKELHKATGGPCGSLGIDREFERLLRAIFGADFMDQFKLKRPAAYVDLMVAFEARKRNATPDKDTPLNISLPFSFIDYYKKCKGTTVEQAIKRYGNKEVKWSSQGMLRLEPAAMRELFRPTLARIKEHIGGVLGDPRLGSIHYLFLVGGFAESQMLQKELREAFAPHTRVIIPQGVSLAILRGAVLFGLDPMVVNVRRSRLTYGVGVLNRFVHGVHPPSKLVVKDGIEWCADVFDAFVLADQSVGQGDAVVRSYTPAKSGQTRSIIHVYCSERDDVRFITDQGVIRCGTLVLDLSDTRHTPLRRREIQARMVFGETEIKVSALDVATQMCVRADIDFLNQ
ncbi:heat shock 70 kDa protein 12A-like isoform X1 [Dermacentor andersoni]|uniref:heat shock 70 kDa protein 12A-like isoform X1 n=2 Tax=Dermacentor andersoni TaxID=34620 RepID=UPI00215567AE|nr:heat shock 70 kDa protein 12A-like isoform X1 [Dermacentor andersoni]